MSIVATDPVEAPVLRGELRLGFATGHRGVTVFAERFRRGLFHFGQGYHEDKRLVVQVLNPTAGLFAGDSLRSELSLSAGAEAAILAPSSTQVYTMPAGGWARSSQTIRIDERAALFFHPRWAVLHRGSRLSQTTTVEMAESASLLFVEPIAAGRVAHGELREFDRYRSAFSLRRGGRLVIRENCEIGGGLRDSFWRHRDGMASFVASVFAVVPGGFDCLRTLQEHLLAAIPASISFGLSEVEAGVLVVRLLARGNRELQAALQTLCMQMPPFLRYPQSLYRTL